MLEKPSTGAVDPLRELAFARAQYTEFKERLLAALTRLREDPNDSENAKALVQVERSFQSALAHFGKQEAELEKHRDTFFGIIDGGALDLDAARAEVLARLAKHRERGPD